MELIPILSTIILVATISTFILAVGAYILYKIQEGEADRKVKKGVETEQAELVEPSEIGGKKLVLDKTLTEESLAPQHYRTVQPVTDAYGRTGKKTTRSGFKRRPAEPKFMKFTSQGYVTTKEDQNAGTIRWR